MAGRQRKPLCLVATGFTLVELMIVVLILAVVAMLVVPRVTSATEEARESAVATNLGILRRQIELYKSEHKGRGPHLNEAGIPDPANFIPRLTSRTNMEGKLDAAGDCGPYLSEWPTNVYAPAAVAGDIKFGGNPVPPRNDTTGWYFSVTAATMHVNTTEGED